MASTVAFAPVPQFAVYAASKAYVVSYTEALQAELARRADRSAPRAPWLGEHGLR